MHRAVVDYYRSLLPPSLTYFLAPFSIRKVSNIYGIVFGSANPLGIDKFLQVAWKKDTLNGEADFDIDRNNVQMSMLHPTKLGAFEEDLEARIQDGSVVNERDVLLVVFRHGVKRQHAGSVLKRLSAEFESRSTIPRVHGFSAPRMITRREGRLF